MECPRRGCSAVRAERQGRYPTGCRRPRVTVASVGRSISRRENNSFTVSSAGGSVCLVRNYQLLLASLLTALLLSGNGIRLHAATTVGKASTTRATRDAAVRDIPFDRLTPEARAKISSVVTNPSMFRRMPVNVVECDPDLYRFLIRHPEVVVNIWQLMGITNVSVERKGPFTIDATDGVGTVTRVELVYGTDDTHLIYCEGSYEGPLFPNRLNGRCVLLLRSGFEAAESNRWQVTNRLDIFLQVDHVGVDALTRTLHPLFGKSADTNFVESIKFLERIARTSEENGPGMQRLAQRLDKVDPDVRTRFAELTTDVFQNAQQRLAALENADAATPPSEELERR